MSEDWTGELAPLDEVDDGVLRELRETANRVDPLPAGFTDRVKFALTVQALHAEVAELTQGDLALTRGEGVDVDGDGEMADQTSTMTFSSDSVSIMVTVTPQGGGELARIDGWLTCDTAEVELVRPTGPASTVRVTDGRFVIEEVAPGPARLVVHPASGRPVVTPTFTL